LSNYRSRAISKFIVDFDNIYEYRIVDTIVWIKLTKENGLNFGHSYYFRHAKEICLVALKGEAPDTFQPWKLPDVIVSKKESHSKKPEALYQIAEMLWPNGRYLELFGRKHNVRPGWVTIGD
jgi:mRNA m6A methyltransferase catalytic subunit